MKPFYKTLLIGLALFSLHSTIRAQHFELDTLSTGETRIVSPDDSLGVVFAGGTLVLQGYFDKSTQFPVSNGSYFPGIAIPAGDNLPPGAGTIVFRNCALLEPSEGESKRYYHLPITFERINLVFENCWLYGDSLGVNFNGRETITPRSGLYAEDTWFSLGSEGILSTVLANVGDFSCCRFALGDTGVRINNGELSFANCEFVSLNTGISISGTGRLNLSNCLFQSCRTMLELSDSVTVAIDSSSFYEVESFCLAASSDSSLMDVSVNHCWFDSSSIANDQLLENLPAGIITNQSDVKLNAGSDLVDIVIHVDDSEPMEASPGEFVRPVILTASFSYDDQNNAPIMPRHINLFSLPQSLLADSLHYLLNDPLYRKSRIVSRADVTLQGGLPTSRTDIITLDTLYFPLDENYFFVGTSDDEF
jgi:hypothetical protein